MRVIVLGAGVVGVTTAYALARDGHEVTVIERACSVATETSKANGAQLSFSYTDPMATPNMLLRLPSVLMGKDPAFQVKKVFSKDLICWGLSFVRNCSPYSVSKNLMQLLTLATESEVAFRQIVSDLKLPSVNRSTGKLLVAQTDKSFRAGAGRAALKRKLGVKVETLSKAEALEVEPLLDEWQRPIAGVFYSPEDETYDAHEFTKSLARYCYDDAGVRFHLSTNIEKLIFDHRKVVGVKTDKGEFRGDACIVCLGPFGGKFLADYGIKLNMYPIKGHSVSFPTGTRKLNVSITDLERKMVFANLGHKLRVAGLSDFVGHDLSVDEKRVKHMVETAQSVLPVAADYSHQFNKWSGLRPAMPDGIPEIGPSKFDGLFLNMGHGMLGWTLAMGSANRITTALRQKAGKTYQSAALTNVA